MIIGITGTNGSGKGTVVDYLKAKGFTHYSARAFITAEIERRGLPVNRDNTRLVANDLRKTHEPTYIIGSLLTEALAEGKDAVIESVRVVAEAELLKGQGAVILATDADRKLRYERVVARQSELDKISFETFCEQEEREMNALDAWDMSVAGVMAMADYTIQNNGSLEELHAKVDEILHKIR